MIEDSSVLRDTINTMKRRISGTQVIFGAAYKANNRLSLGMSMTPSVSMNVTGNADGVSLDKAVNIYYSAIDSTGTVYIVDSLMYDSYKLPSRFRVGLSYSPRNIMKTTLNLDVELVDWEVVNNRYDKEFNFYIGVENHVINKLPLRLGFNYQTTYQLVRDYPHVLAQKISTPAFSTGTAFNLMKNLVLDLGFEVSKRSYEALDLFADSFYNYPALWANPQYLNFQDRGWENPDTVSEVFYKFQATLSLNW